jgi:hypothetical protein
MLAQSQTMDAGISEIVGQALLEGGARAQVYRALRDLLCATCGVSIAEGSLFTRRTVKGIGISIMPQCSKCAPFTLRTSRQEKSALLRSLLAEHPAASSAQPGDSTEVDSGAAAKKKNIDEAVRRRLGPALRRGRGGSKSR